MENETIVLSREDINNIITDVRASVQAIEKGSKLRKHMMNMVSMNNIMRAFIYSYEMDVDCKTIQEKLLQTILTVEARKDRKFLNADVNVLKEAVEKYDVLLFSATEEQVSEIALFVKNNSGDCKYIVKHGKELKSSRN
jgi:triphosphoribosyl-dephospho-CoA synthetase